MIAHESFGFLHLSSDLYVAGPVFLPTCRPIYQSIMLVHWEIISFSPGHRTCALDHHNLAAELLPSVEIPTYVSQAS